MVRVAIADPFGIVRRGVRSIVEAHPDWIACGEAADGQDAIDLGLREKPDVMVLEIALPTVNGLTVIRRIRKMLPTTRVLVFTGFDDEETIGNSLSAGARGYLLKSESDHHLDAAISAVAVDRPYFSSPVSDLLLRGLRSGRRPTLLANFSSRELEVAQLVAEGHSNKVIARMLSLSIKTVESHRGGAMRKAGVRSAAELVRFAVSQNLIHA